MKATSSTADESRNSAIGDELTAYAARILAGTGLSTQDAVNDHPAQPGTAGEALRHGWQTADRAARVRS
ncbi:hypothetical protein BKG82_27800 [Mycobacteroides chelonae]|uniref:Uncharacterized protein n=1 Tax=Mycobacteroides chelonae TaxID=1774 RepID=A0A1S1LCM8_MYCCH|nr:hypothetical protein [Mycobacteroides chelonae]OHU47413.1 hypothetical protein BKG82_27800 [Mycobacteroides chelonae]